MKHLFTIGALLLIVCISCKKDHAAPYSPSGYYIESSPTAGFTILRFVGDTMFKSESGVAANIDTFRYVISDGYITLTQKNTSSKLEFSMTSNSSFRIENLYPSIPENPRTYMVFSWQW